MEKNASALVRAVSLNVLAFMLVACAASPRRDETRRTNELAKPANTAASSSNGNVKGTARRYPSWCAGVAPRQEDQQRMQAGVPMTTPLRVYEGGQFSGGAPVAQIDMRGGDRFAIELPPGRYCVMASEREAPDAPMPAGADMACLKQYRSTCDDVWIVDAGGGRSARGGGAIKIEDRPGCSYNAPCLPPGPPPP